MLSCAICNSENTKKIANLVGSRTNIVTPLYACIKCNFLFQRPDYKEDDKTLLGDLRWHIKKKDVYYNFSSNIISEMLKIKPDAKSLVDVGCGIGTTLLAGNKLGLVCEGIEPNVYACEYAKENYDLDIVEGYLNPSSFSEKFDFVIVDNVLEHVPEPRIFMDYVFSLLNDGGVMYLAVPGNKGGVIRVIFSLLLLRHKLGMFRDNDAHINHFSTKSLEILCGYNDASIVKTLDKCACLVQKNLSECI